jgi:hypothetical protein
VAVALDAPVVAEEGGVVCRHACTHMAFDGLLSRYSITELPLLEQLAVWTRGCHEQSPHNSQGAAT